MSQEKSPQKIMVYGLDSAKFGSINPICNKVFELHFETLNTTKKFHDYDGVVFFKGIFETISHNKGNWEPYSTVDCESDQLDKRSNELRLLFEKNGFICCLLTDPIEDHGIGKRNQFNHTDLSKKILNTVNISRENYQRRVSPIMPRKDEFRDFLKHYGAASTYFSFPNGLEELDTIATFNGDVTGFSFYGNTYFLPCLFPDSTEEFLNFFNELGSALVSSDAKAKVSIPIWVDEFHLLNDQAIKEEKRELLKKLNDVETREGNSKRYKSILAFSGDRLVSEVIHLMQEELQLKIDPTDDFKEDFKLLNKEGDPLALFEIKGINKNIKREHISQVDTHRERSEFRFEFPGVLIANTFIKKPKEIKSKYEGLPLEHVSYAVSQNVLILRTIDLLHLLNHYISGKITMEGVIELFTQNKGWLKVCDENIEILLEG